MLILRRILFGLLALIMVGVAISIVVSVVNSSRHRAILAAAKASGLPITMADLQQHSLPVSQNAAPLYVHLKGILAAAPLTSSQKILERLNGRSFPTTADWAQATQAIHERTDLYSVIHQAAGRPRCVFTRNWALADPINIKFFEFATVRQAARLLTVQSLVLAHQGRIDEAIQNQVLGFTIARHGASDPTMISYLVGMACDAITLAGLDKIVFLSHGSAKVAATVKAVIEQQWKARSLSTVFKSEVAFEQSEIEYWRKTGPEGMSNLHSMTAAQDSPELKRNWNGLLNDNSEYLLHQMSQVIKLADEPYLESQPQIHMIDSEVLDRSQNDHFISVMLWPVPEQLAEKRAQIQATVNVDRAGCAVLVEWGKTGHLPEHLPGKFMDPFMDAPLQYRREGKDGFVVYSVGQDADFDGGKPGVKQKSSQVYFRYPAIPES